jgi:hypothetical protein
LVRISSRAAALSVRRRRAATFQRQIDISIQFNKEGRTRTRIIRISRAAHSAGEAPFQPSAPYAETAKAAPPNGSENPHMPTVETHADENGGRPEIATVRENTAEPTIADGADAKSLYESGAREERPPLERKAVKSKSEITFQPCYGT